MLVLKVVLLLLYVELSTAVVNNLHEPTRSPAFDGNTWALEKLTRLGVVVRVMIRFEGNRCTDI